MLLSPTVLPPILPVDEPDVTGLIALFDDTDFFEAGPPEAEMADEEVVADAPAPAAGAPLQFTTKYEPPTETWTTQPNFATCPWF